MSRKRLLLVIIAGCVGLLSLWMLTATSREVNAPQKAANSEVGQDGSDLESASLQPTSKAMLAPTSTVTAIAVKTEAIAGSAAFLTGASDGEPLEIALAYLRSQRSELGLEADEFDHALVTDQYTSKHNGVTHIYLRQRYQGLEVANANMNINVAKDGSIINMGTSFVPDLSSAVNTTQPEISPVQALADATGHLGLTLSQTPAIQESIGGISQEVILSRSGVSQDEIPVKLEYYALSAEDVVLVWSLKIHPLDNQHYWDIRVNALNGELVDKADWVIHENYNVYAIPLIDPADGSRTIEVNPYQHSPSAASPFGWHDTNGTAGPEYTITRGNNVHAYEDSSNRNASIGNEPNGGAGLVFDFPVNLTQQPSTYMEASVANLFYWNNILHDIHYEYGFDEASGNFQENNYGHGGLGADGVHAEGQDGSGFNNANMLTYPDGGLVRMQMYLGNNVTPMRDGSFDNVVVVHEYGHGVSLRLTGGPGTVSGLQGAQSGGMGEGWSDWWGLVFTAQVGDTNVDARTVGTWLFGQAPDGPGIRPYPYSTDMGINPHTYADISGVSIPHGVGSVWCAALWDMYWNLVAVHGFDPDLYGGAGGNNIAMQLVVDGLKLQPMSPTFLDARDAILLADQVNNGGANKILIWQAFAKRGMGFSADDGGHHNTVVVTEAFDVPDDMSVSPAMDLISIGFEGGPFDPVSIDYQLTNNGSATLTWSASSTQPWIDFSLAGGLLKVGESVNVTASINGVANSLVPGTYSDVLTFMNMDSGVTFNRSARLVVLETPMPPEDPFNPMPIHGAVGVLPDIHLTWNNSESAIEVFADPAAADGYSSIPYDTNGDGNVIHPVKRSFVVPIQSEFSGIIVNGDFEFGDLTGWTMTDSTGWGGWQLNSGTFDPSGPGMPQPPFSGVYSAVSYQTGAGIRTLYQDVILPSAGSISLEWSHMIRNHASAFVDPDQEFRVEIRDLTDHLLSVVYSTDPGDALLQSWTTHSADLTEFAGSQVRIAFAQEDHNGYFNVHLDEVVITGSRSSYAVYMGTNSLSMTLVGSDLSQALFDPGTLELDTTYYWQVIASNMIGSATGSVWQFTTARDVTQFDSATYSVDEAAGEVVISVSRLNGSLDGVSVDYMTGNGTATAGSDYMMTTGTLSFSSSELSKTISVPIVNDTHTEIDETLYLDLTNPSAGVALGTTYRSEITILDDDAIHVAMFFNGSYVDTGTSTSGEALNLKAALEQKSCVVSTFTDFSASGFSTALATADILYIPELEKGDLGAAMMPDAKAVIADFIAAGGGLIIHGQMATRDETLLNGIFGYSLSSSGASGGTTLLTGDALGTSFEGGPASIPNNNGTYAWSKPSLPAGSLSIYDNSGTSTTVALLQHGLGKIVFLAYDWYDGVPRGSQDGGWDDVLKRALLEVLVPHDDLDITPRVNFALSGGVGGPFTPTYQIYTLTNSGDSNLNWTVSPTEPWIIALPTNGMLSSGASVHIFVSVTAAAESLPAGIYSDAVVFNNVTSGYSQTRDAELTVIERVLDSFAWDPVATNQTVNAPFNVSIAAVDQFGARVTSFTNAVDLSCRAGGGSLSTNILGDVVHMHSASGSYTLGYSFTPSTNLTVTHVRHYSGAKVSIWSDAGVLLASEPVAGIDGQWTETALSTPLLILAGQTYRVGFYTSGMRYWGGSDSGSFAHGTIHQGYHISGDGFPDIENTARWWLVDLQYEVGASGPIPMIPGSADFVSGVWTGTVTVLDAATNAVLIADDGAGHTGETGAFDVDYVGVLSVSLPASAIETAGVLPSAGQVHVTPPPATALAVDLSSDDTSELTVPATVVIPAGATNVIFSPTVHDDAELDMTQHALVTASSPGYLSGSRPMAIVDNETAVLTLNAPVSVQEGSGLLVGQGVVNVDSIPTVDVEVMLNLSQTNDIVLPSASTTILAGETNALFNMHVLDNGSIDGARQVALSAEVSGWTTGTTLITVLDDEDTDLVLRLPPQVAEGNGILAHAGEVFISGTWPSDLMVTLSSDDLSELNVPPTVSILQGQTNVFFDLDVRDDTIMDGAQTVTVSASAALFTGANAAVLVQDNEALIQGNKWADLNTNSVLDTGEPELENWKIFVDINANNEFDEGEPFSITDAAGQYSLSVTSGQYRVGEVMIDEWMQTFPGGSGDTVSSNTLTELGNCFYPNVLVYNFTNLPPAVGDAVLTVYALADLGSSSEYIALEAEGHSLGNLFVVGGGEGIPRTLNLDITQTLLDGWLADGEISFQATPSRYVDNFFITEELRLTLQYPVAEHMHTVDVGYGETVTNVNFGNMITGLYINVVLPESATEGDGSIAGQVELSYPAFGDTWVTMTSDDPSSLSVTNALLIPEGATNAAFTVFVLDDAELDGTQPTTIQADSPGYQSGYHTMGIHDNESASLSLSLPQTTDEAAGFVSGAVVVDRAPDQDVVVTLLSNNESEIRGTNVVILAGQTGVFFDLAVVDDDLLDGIQTATITAHVENWNDSSSSVFIFDDEDTKLTLELPEGAMEGDGILTNAGRVSIFGTVGTDMHVVLSSSDASVVSVPLAVTIPQGQSSVSFDLNIGDDLDSDGLEFINVVAIYPGYLSGADSMYITDNDIHHFHVSVSNEDKPHGTPFMVELTAENINAELLPEFSNSVSITVQSDQGLLPVVPDSAVLTAGQWNGDLTINGFSNGARLIVDDGTGHTGTSTVFNVTAPQIMISPDHLTNTLVIAGESFTRNMVISNAGNADLEFEFQVAGSGPGEVDPDLIAHYPFNGNADDESGNGHDGTVNGATLTTDRFGNPDSAYDFNGSSDHINCGNIINGFSMFTVSAWINIDRYTGDRYMGPWSQTLFAVPIPAWQSAYKMLTSPDNSFGTSMLWTDGTLLDSRVDHDIPLGEWHLITQTYDGVAVRQYDNGVLVNAVDSPGHSVSNSWDFLIGKTAGYPGGTVSVHHFDGAIDDLRVYNRALSPSEIEDLYNESDDSSLIAHYPFNGNADDESDNGNDGSADFASAGSVLFSDGFEDGNYDGWAEGSGTMLREVTSTTAAEGLYSFSIDGASSHYQGVSRMLPALRPARIDLHVRSSNTSRASGYFVAGSNSSYSETAIFFYISNGYMQIHDFRSNIYPCNSGQWYKISFLMDWEEKRFDFLVDDVLVRSNMLFRSTSVEVLNKICLYNYATARAWWDGIIMGGLEEPGVSWLAVDPSSGTVPSGSNIAVAVEFDAAGFMAGDHLNTMLTVTCNDPLSPSNGVPVSMWVVPPAPVMVTEPELTVGTTNEVAWSAVDGPVDYRVEMASATNAIALQDSGWLAETIHPFSGLGSNVVYYYRAKASVDSSIGRLDGAWSDWVWSRQVFSLTDFDGDGMPNWWETLYFGSSDLCDPCFDTDGDGQINRDEYIAGMNPTNEWSCFMVNAAYPMSNGSFVLSWEAVTGRVYSVQWKDCMTNSFQALETGIRHPQGSYTDSVHGVEDCGFYTIDVELDASSGSGPSGPSDPPSLPPF